MEQEFEQYMKAVKLLEDSGIPQEVLKKEKAEVYEQLSEVNREIRAEREKWKLCREICQQTPVHTRAAGTAPKTVDLHGTSCVQGGHNALRGP